ncbi:ABC transporter substrate-binding protein [Methanothrix sp.]|uniref:ABC transporter substrate-binding protein n=1 Tax=Methanothrix sp. TaxID=90426 RepID=UPI002580E2FE|nr:ABC transporter substrate-binding protein [Methanothrix sp.]NPU87838.1 ABC transporter substrate-binding protein [Methanothrix sp.]
MRGFVFALVLVHCMMGAILDVNAAEYTLGIFGNANMDSTIDEQDVSYLRGIISGVNPVTELADATYDGMINEGDIEQIQRIINGSEDYIFLKTFTIYDKAKVVRVPMPVSKIAILNLASAEAIRCVDAEEMVTAVGTSVVEGTNKEFFGELSNRPTVGKWSEPDVESIIQLRPEVVIADLRFPDTELLEDKLNSSGIAVVRMGFTYPDYFQSEMMALGYMLNRKSEAEDLLDFAYRYVDLIEERLASIPADEMPRVYPIYSPSDFWKTGSNGSIVDMLCGLAGGRNIAHDLKGGTGGMYPTVDPEWVIKEDPEIIFTWSSPGGYSVLNDTDMVNVWNSIVKSPELSQVSAVKNNRVYLLTTEITSRPRWFVGLAYLAKWFYPDYFKDLDPEAIHEEYLERYQKVKYQGTFVYPTQTSA